MNTLNIDKHTFTENKNNNNDKQNSRFRAGKGNWVETCEKEKYVIKIN